MRIKENTWTYFCYVEHHRVESFGKISVKVKCTNTIMMDAHLEVIIYASLHPKTGSVCKQKCYMYSDS